MKVSLTARFTITPGEDHFAPGARRQSQVVASQPWGKSIIQSTLSALSASRHSRKARSKSRATNLIATPASINSSAEALGGKIMNQRKEKIERKNKRTQTLCFALFFSFLLRGVKTRIARETTWKSTCASKEL